jgi:hypothetical protein
MHEAEQIYETLKDAEKLYEEQQQEKLKLVDHEDEATEEDLKEDLDREDLIEQAVELEEKLVQQGESQEEIDVRVEESIETTKIEAKLEKIIEEQEREKLKLIDHEDEASEEDLKEDLDRVDLIEQAVELEEKLAQQGKSQGEIDVRVEGSIEETLETAKFEEKLEKIIEKERKELINREDEESVEKEDLDRVDLIEQAVELEEKLVQQGKSQEEIEVRVEGSIEETLETAKFEEKLEKITEKERKELINREDDEEIGVTREYIDRPAEAEYYMEQEEELRRQGMSQEEIDEQMEEIANRYQNEINNKPENEQATNVSEELEKQVLEIKEQNSSAEQCDQIELSALSNEKEVETYENVENKENLEVLKTELDAIESKSEDKKDLLEENTELESEESDEEESEHLQELYHQETRRRPIYARKKTKGYSQWLEQRELGSEKIKNSKSESEKIKEIKEEDWKTTLKQWIKEASEEECNAELKSELKNVLESYNEFEDLARKFMELYEKSQYEKLSEKEKNILKSLTKRLRELDPIKLELLTSVFFIKKYITEQYWDDFWNQPLVNRVLNKFFKHISQKYKNLIYNKQNLLNKTNNKDHPTYIFYQDMKALLKGKGPSEVSDRELGRLLGQNRNIFLSVERNLKNGNYFYGDNHLYRWIYNINENQQLSEEVKKSFKDMVMDYRKANGLTNQDLDVVILVGDLRLSIQHDPDFRGRQGPSVTKLNEYFGLFSKSQVLQGKVKNQHLLRMIYGLYRRSSGEFMLNNLGKSQISDDKGVSLSVKKALLAINKYCASKNFLVNEEVKSLQKLVLLLSWYLSDIYGVGGIYLDMKEIGSLLSIAVDKIRNLISGKTLSTKKINIKNFKDQINNLRKLLTESQFTLLKQLYNNLDYPNNDLLINVNQKEIVLKDNGIDGIDESIIIQVKPSQKINIKEIDGNIIIKTFPEKSRNIICEEIYRTLKKNKRISNSKMADTLIYDLKDVKTNTNWLNKLPMDELKELRNKLAKYNINNEFEGSMIIYFQNLTNLVKELKDLNKENQKINFSELSRDFISQTEGLYLTKRGLEQVISRIYNHFKNIFDDFKLVRVKRKALFGTESEKISIRSLRKEYKLLIELNDGLYGGQCSNPSCHTDFKRLPVFDFHHEDPKIKTITWNEIMHKNYDWIKNTLEAQKVRPICKNCHLPDHAKIFNDFKDAILKNDLFTYSSKKIDNILNLAVRRFMKENNTNYTAYSLKFEVKRWIKKRSVFEQVFNGKCISCGEDRLPSLQAHHTDQDLKVHKWGDVSRKWNIKKLINEFIIEEECVCLCGNCHAMINTKNFENNIEEVLGEKYIQEVKADYYKINKAIKNNANRIKKIKNGIFKLNIKDHLNDE